MRHNAIVQIIYDKLKTPLSFYIPSHGARHDVRNIMRAALSKQYSSVKHKPDRAAVNIFCRFNRHTEVNLIDTLSDDELRSSLFTYLVNFDSTVPRITIKHNTNALSETLGFFNFIGQENKVNVPEATTVPAIGKRRRGRPSRLSYLKEPVPDKYLNKSNTIINFTGVENYASYDDDRPDDDFPEVTLNR